MSLDIKDYLSYDPESGVFTWIKGRKGIKKDRIAGRVDSNGYITICFNYKHYLAHRLAWFYVKGEWPSGLLDHENRVKKDNRIVNLRIATYSQNGANCKGQDGKTSSHKGVSWHKRDKRWRVVLGKKHVGNYLTEDEAAVAYNKAATERYGEFARVNTL
jgi:hypothetical protein